MILTAFPTGTTAPHAFMQLHFTDDLEVFTDFLCVCVFSGMTQKKIDEIDDANVTPADYSIMIRGLPTDVTKEEVRETVTLSGICVRVMHLSGLLL